MTCPKIRSPREAFLERRANAYQAYYESMPLRLANQPQGSKMPLYRNVAWGNLAQFTILDTRQYRTDQPCGDGRKAPCAGVYNPAGTLMGDTQEAWFQQSLDKSPAQWNVVANQVLMARVDLKPGEGEEYSMDQWSGYQVNQDRVMKFLADRKPRNPIVITGDIHSSWVNDLKVNWKNENDPVVGTEFTGTSISSAGDGVDERPDTQAIYRENPHLKMFNGRRGFVMVTLDNKQCRADYRIVPYVTKAGATPTTHSSWIVENDRRGVQKA